jgi:hypothetical protein
MLAASAGRSGDARSWRQSAPSRCAVVAAAYRDFVRAHSPTLRGQLRSTRSTELTASSVVATRNSRDAGSGRPAISWRMSSYRFGVGDADQHARRHAVRPKLAAFTEKARALAWELLDLDQGTVAVWRSERIGRDRKTAKSRRTLLLGAIVTDALVAWRADQEHERTAAGGHWAAQCGHRAAVVQGHLRACRPRAGPDAPGASPHLRVAAERERHADRGDCRFGRPQLQPYHRNRLPAAAQAGVAGRRGSDGRYIFGCQETRGQQDDEPSHLPPG